MDLVRIRACFFLLLRLETNPVHSAGHSRPRAALCRPHGRRWPRRLADGRVLVPGIRRGRTRLCERCVEYGRTWTVAVTDTSHAFFHVRLAGAWRTHRRRVCG